MKAETSLDWRVVPWFHSYEVSQFGDVRHIARKRFKKQRLDTAGRPTVTLSCPDGKTRPKMVHRLVAEAFLGPMPQGLETCHKDGNKTNCRADNLRYGTKSSNEADKIAHGTSNRGERNGRAKLSAEQVVALRSDGRQADTIAAELGVTPSLIYAIRRGVIWSAAA